MGKIVAGISFGICGNLAAAAIEHARHHAGSAGVPSKCAPLLPDGTHVLASDLSARVMFVPYLFVGVGEALWAPAMYQLAYSSAPERMRPLLQAFNLFSMGAMPSAISASISRAVAPLVPNDLDDGNIAALGVLGIALLLAAYRFAPEDVKRMGWEVSAKAADLPKQAEEGDVGNPAVGTVRRA